MWKTDIFKWYSFFFSCIILLEMLMIPCQTCSYSSHYHCIIGYPQMFTTSKPNDSIPIHNFSDCILIPKLQIFKSTISYSQLKQYEEVYDSIIGIKKDSTSADFQKVVDSLNSKFGSNSVIPASMKKKKY